MDANVIVGDPNLHSRVWGQLTDAIVAGRARVLAPEVAIEESIAIRKRSLKALGRKISSSAAYAPEAAQHLAKQAQDLCLTTADEYGDKLRRAWADARFEVMDTSSASHATVARRAIERKRPFNDQGNGYRDTLHWLSLLSFAEANPHEPVVLLTADKIFSTNSGSLLPDLLTEFAKSSAATILLKQKLENIDVPGHYVSDPIPALQYEESLRDRLTAFLSDEYALRRMKTKGVYAPNSDWDDLTRVANLNFANISSRDIERVSNPEVQFRATATFTVRGSYIVDDEPDFPDLITKDVDLNVEVTGLVETLGADTVGTLRDIEAVLVGEDLMYEQERFRH